MAYIGSVSISDNPDGLYLGQLSLQANAQPNQLLIIDSSNNVVGLDSGTANQILTSNGSGNAPTWQNNSNSGLNLICLIRFSASGGNISIISSKGNFASLTRISQGLFQVNFNTTLTDDNYSFFVSASQGIYATSDESLEPRFYYTEPNKSCNTTNFKFATTTDTAWIDPDICCVMLVN